MSDLQTREVFDKIAIRNHWNINRSGNGTYYSTIIEARYQGWLLSIERIDSLDRIATDLQVTCDKQSKRMAELEQENQILIEELKEARAESGRFGVGA